MMNLTCAILHADRQVSEQLEAFIAKTPFLALCGKYSNPIEALKGYYDNNYSLRPPVSYLLRILPGMLPSAFGWTHWTI